MAKTSVRYSCRDCGAIASKWQGQCADCGEWNTLEELSPTMGVVKQSSAGGYAGQRAVASLTEVAADGADNLKRHSSGFAEFDRVLTAH